MNKENVVEFVDAQSVLAFGYILIAVPATNGVGLVGSANAAMMVVIFTIAIVVGLAGLAASNRSLRAACGVNAVLLGALAGASLFACMCAGFESRIDFVTVPAGVVIGLTTATMTALFVGALEFFESKK